MRGRLSAALMFAACLCAGLAQAQLPEIVAKALQQAGISHGHVGVLIQELDGATLLQHGAERALNPASVMKLLTTLAALDSLGPAHTFKTRVWLQGELRDGVLQGNLVFQGGGDPGLTQERFWLLLRELRQRGLEEIRGDVLLDTTYYAIPAEDPGDFDQAPLRPYNAQPGALLVNYNTHILRLGGQGGVSARLDPPGERPHLDNRLQPVEGLCNNWSGGLETRLERGALVLEGSLPRLCGERSLALNLLPPTENTTAWFRALWQELGGRHSGGQLRLGTPDPEARLFLEFDSLPLSLLARDVNKYSNNVMAKMLFLNLGAWRFGAPATWAKGEQALRDWLADKALEVPGLVLENGSGLSRRERISATGLSALLRWAARQPVYYEFAASLPAVGLEGTQKNRFNCNGANGNGANGNGPDGSAECPDRDLRGRAWLKTGSLNNVRALAGYVLGLDGQRRSLVFLINDPNADKAAKAQDALLEWTVSYANTPVSTQSKAVNQQ